MSVVPFPAPASSSSAHDALAELVAGRDELEHFLEDVFGQLENLWTQLEERQRALCADRQRFEEQLRDYAAQSDRQRTALDEQKHRTHEQVRREVAEATADIAEAMVQQRRQMAEERSQWREELTRMRQLLEIVAGRQGERGEGRGEKGEGRVGERHGAD